jgi:hypothetical protein
VAPWSWPCKDTIQSSQGEIKHELPFLRAKATVEKASLQVDLEFVCQDQFNNLQNKMIELKALKTKGEVNNPTILSEAEDKNLIETVGTYKQKLVDIEKPRDDLEKLYPDTINKRARQERDAARRDLLAQLASKFPKLMSTCRETLTKYRTECNEKYRENFDAAYDCSKFYEKRVYWEMSKQGQLVKNLNPKDAEFLRSSYEDSFEDDIKKRAAAKDTKSS